MHHQNHLGKKTMTKIHIYIEYVHPFFRTAIPYYNQLVKQEAYDDSEPGWKSLSTTEKQNYTKRRKEVSNDIHETVKIHNFILHRLKLNI